LEAAANIRAVSPLFDSLVLTAHATTGAFCISPDETLALRTSLEGECRDYRGAVSFNSDSAAPFI